MLEWISAVGFVLLLLAAFVWKFGHRVPGSGFLRMPQRAEKSLRSSERLRLTPQHSVHMIEAAGKTLLIGCYTGGMVMLADATASEPAGAALAARRGA